MRDGKSSIQVIDAIKEVIATRGFYTYVVSGGGDPHYAYTIGLSQTLGAELIVAGSYFYKLEELPLLIQGVVNTASQSDIFNGGNVALQDWGSFSFRRVDESWVSLLMLGALDFYASEEVKAIQIVPDGFHMTLDVPTMDRPWDPTLEPAWRWLREEWPYAMPIKSVAITDLDALRGGSITEVMRWEEDEWEMFAGQGPSIPQENRRVVPIGVILSTD